MLTFIISICSFTTSETTKQKTGSFLRSHLIHPEMLFLNIFQCFTWKPPYPSCFFKVKKLGPNLQFIASVGEWILRNWVFCCATVLRNSDFNSYCKWWVVFQIRLQSFMRITTVQPLIQDAWLPHPEGGMSRNSLVPAANVRGSNGRIEVRLGMWLWCMAALVSWVLMAGCGSGCPWFGDSWLLSLIKWATSDCSAFFENENERVGTSVYTTKMVGGCFCLACLGQFLAREAHE